MANHTQSAFTVQPLSKPAPFFADAKAGFSLVEGAGQTLFWRNCYVLVFRTGENKTPVAKHEVGDGEGVLPVGLDAFLGGPAGKFKAMSAEEVEAMKKKKEEEEEKKKINPEEEKTIEKEKEEEKDVKKDVKKEEEEKVKKKENVANDEGERKAAKKRKVCSACKGKGYIVEES